MPIITTVQQHTSFSYLTGSFIPPLLYCWSSLISPENVAQWSILKFKGVSRKHLSQTWFILQSHISRTCIHAPPVNIMLLLLTGHPWNRRSPSWLRLQHWRKTPGGAARGSVPEASTTQTSGRRCSARPGGTRKRKKKIIFEWKFKKKAQFMTNVHELIIYPNSNLLFMLWNRQQIQNPCNYIRKKKLCVIKMLVLYNTILYNICMNQ